MKSLFSITSPFVFGGTYKSSPFKSFERKKEKAEKFRANADVVILSFICKENAGAFCSVSQYTALLPVFSHDL